MTKTKLFVASIFALTTGAAFAQDASAPAEGAPAEAAPAEGEAAATTEAAPADTAPVVEASMGGYPIEVIDRPRVLPKGMMQAGIDLTVARLSVTAGTTTVSSTNIGGLLSFDYGVMPKLSVGATYGFGIDPSNFDKNLTLNGRYEVMPNAPGAGMNAAAFADIGLANGLPFHVGLDFHYKLSPKMEIFAPVALGGTLDAFTLALNLPVGVGFQASPNIYASVDTHLATIGLKPSGTTSIADAQPVHLNVMYSMSNMMDLGLRFGSSSIGDVADLFDAAAMFRYRM